MTHPAAMKATSRTPKSSMSRTRQLPHVAATVVLLATTGSIAACESQAPPQAATPAAGSPKTEPKPVGQASSKLPSTTMPAASAATKAKLNAKAVVWDFEGAKPGSTPEGWTAAVGKWEIVATPVENAKVGERVLYQAAKSRGPIFNLVLTGEPQMQDVALSVQFRAEAGKIDQGGGLIWRARDARNYYVARHNPLEDNYRVYKVTNGRRKQLGSANVSATSGVWHTLRVTMVGDHIECFLNGKKELDVHDTTFTEAGQVGLWTKADAQTEFDGLIASSPSPLK